MRSIYVKAVALFCALSVSAFCVAHATLVAHAQVPDPSQEAIVSLHSTITVNLDNSVDVREEVQYATGAQQRHGMYRDIDPHSSEGRSMDIRNIRVTDENGNPSPWVKTSNGGDVRIKIGDPNVTFTGTRTYDIYYTATNAIGHPKDVDEIYWNVTGNDWAIPVYGAEADVILPGSLSAVRSACYFGRSGSTAQCQEGNSPAYSFKAPSALSPGEGLTIAVGFPKGIIPAYTAADDVAGLWQQYAAALLLLLVPISVFIGMFMRWRKVGRDPRDDRTIIPEYDVPDGLTPFEASCILKQKISPSDISAEIVYLATQGYIKIRRIDNKFLGFISMTDYEFEVVKDCSDLPNDFDIKLMDGIFAGARSPGIKRLLSDLKDVFYKKIPEISDSVVDAMLSKGYYSNLKKSFGSLKSGSVAARSILPALSTFVFPFIIFVIVSVIVDSAGSAIIADNGLLFFGVLIATVIIIVVFNKIMPAKTEKGMLAKDHILGLKLYLQVAEKDRLQFHNAPEKKPETFEKFLPYAMVLGVDKAWAKEFEGLCDTPPTWYEGYPVGSGGFSTIQFTNALSSFGAATSTSMGSAPGGSGGGGSSGGGGGGGGGGGW